MSNNIYYLNRELIKSYEEYMKKNNIDKCNKKFKSDIDSFHIWLSLTNDKKTFALNLLEKSKIISINKDTEEIKVIS